MDRGQFSELLKDEQSHPITLMRLLLRTYGVSWMGWLSTTLRKTIEKDFGVSPANINVHKALGAAAVAMRENFWEDWEHFHFLVQALNNNVPDIRIHRELSVGQMMVAVDIATTIRRELAELSFVPEFNEEVSRYVAAQALNQGVWYLPELLSFAGKFAAGRRYSCKDCGNDAEVLFDDGLCDICIERFDTSRLGSWTPNLELVSKGWGKNIRLYEKNPVDKVRARMEQVVRNPKLTLQETQTDVCVARLMVALQYTGYRRKQLREQAA